MCRCHHYKCARESIKSGWPEKAVKKALKEVLTWPDEALASVNPFGRVGLCCRHRMQSRNVWSLKKYLAPRDLLGRGYLLSARNLLFVDTVGIRHLPDVISSPVHVHSPLDTETYSSATLQYPPSHQSDLYCLHKYITEYDSICLQIGCYITHLI